MALRYPISPEWSLRSRAVLDLPSALLKTPCGLWCLSELSASSQPVDLEALRGVCWASLEVEGTLAGTVAEAHAFALNASYMRMVFSRLCR
jgi:hypothetical protein